MKRILDFINRRPLVFVLAVIAFLFLAMLVVVTSANAEHLECVPEGYERIFVDNPIPIPSGPGVDPDTHEDVQLFYVDVNGKTGLIAVAESGLRLLDPDNNAPDVPVYRRDILKKCGWYRYDIPKQKRLDDVPGTTAIDPGAQKL